MKPHHKPPQWNSAEWWLTVRPDTDIDYLSIKPYGMLTKRSGRPFFSIGEPVPDLPGTMFLLLEAVRQAQEDDELGLTFIVADLLGNAIACACVVEPVVDWWATSECLAALEHHTDPVTYAGIEMSSTGAIQDIHDGWSTA